MPETQKVVLYGSSLFIAGLDTSLSAIPGLEIERVEAKEATNPQKICTGPPDIIIVEMGVASGNLTLSLLRKYPGVTLIALDPDSERLLVLSVKEKTALAATDLVKLIQDPHSSEKVSEP